LSTVNHLLNKTGVILRVAYTSTGAGDDAMAWASNSTEALRYYSASASEHFRVEREDIDFTHVGYMKPTADVMRNDHILVSEDSKQFSVVAVIVPSKSHHLKLILMEIPVG